MRELLDDAFVSLCLVICLVILAILLRRDNPPPGKE